MPSMAYRSIRGGSSFERHYQGHAVTSKTGRVSERCHGNAGKCHGKVEGILDASSYGCSEHWERVVCTQHWEHVERTEHWDYVVCIEDWEYVMCTEQSWRLISNKGHCRTRMPQPYPDSSPIAPNASPVTVAHSNVRECSAVGGLLHAPRDPGSYAE